jgi:hypothetical protein
MAIGQQGDEQPFHKGFLRENVLTYIVPECLYFCPFSHSIKPNINKSGILKFLSWRAKSAHPKTMQVVESFMVMVAKVAEAQAVNGTASALSHSD